MYLVRLLSFIVATRCRFRHRCLLVIFIKEVSFEHSLRRWVFQVDLILLNSIGVLPFLVVYMIFIKVITFLTWKVGCCQLTGLERTPIKIFEPWV